MAEPCTCKWCLEKDQHRPPTIRAFYLRWHLVHKYGNVHWLTKVLYNCHDYGGTHVAYDIPLPD